MNERQNAFLNALLVSPNVTQAARNAGICKATAYKYLKDSAFMSELKARREESTRDAMQYLKSKMKTCAETLIDIVEDKKTPAAIKVQAIQTVFSNVERLTEQHEIIDRMEQVESMIGSTKQKGLMLE